jgi:hypothetical protein
MLGSENGFNFIYDNKKIDETGIEMKIAYYNKN